MSSWTNWVKVLKSASPYSLLNPPVRTNTTMVASGNSRLATSRVLSGLPVLMNPSSTTTSNLYRRVGSM